MAFSDDSLKGRHALVVGSTSGVGYEVASILVGSGAHVVINGRNPERGAAAQEQLRVLADQVDFVAGDVGSPEGARALVDAAAERLGGLDTLVVSGSSTSSPPANFFENSNPDTYVRWATVHWISKMWVTYAAIPHLKRAGGGSVVYVSTDAGRFPTVGEPFACGAAAALHMMTRSISMELKRYRIRINSVATTVMTGSPGMLGDLGEAEKVFRKVRDRQVLGLEPLDVAQACAFLSSGLAGSITGQILSVNGGVSTGI
jgi:2-hydroxycyclohexanecarboxyl-CoA dehydrogenase